MGVENDKRRKARQLIAEAAETHIDQFDGWEGAICTGYVTILEMHAPGGHRCVIWFSGNGNVPDEQRDEGLPSWIVEGMVRKVIRDIDSENVTQEDD